MSEVLKSFIVIIISGLTDFAKGIGTAINDTVTAMFLTTSEQGAVTGLSTFGGVIAIFAGIALAVGITTLIFHFVKGIGK